MLLNDWGIYHFHMGEVMESDQYISRTGPLLFARVTDDAFFVVGVYHHGDWAKQELIQVIHDNWPETIEMYRMKGVIGLANEMNEDSRKSMRNHQISSKRL